MRHHEIYTVHKINMKSSLFLLKAMTIIIRLTHNVLTLGCSPFIWFSFCNKIKFVHNLSVVILSIDRLFCIPQTAQYIQTWNLAYLNMLMCVLCLYHISFNLVMQIKQLIELKFKMLTWKRKCSKIATKMVVFNITQFYAHAICSLIWSCRILKFRPNLLFYSWN